MTSNFVNKQPHRLHCFYNKRSTFIHGEEGEDSSPALGQQVCRVTNHSVPTRNHNRFADVQEIHDRIKSIGYEDCKVYIHSIDSQSSAGGGIIILVIGEMSNRGQTWRKFTQTFFLAEQPNGYFVLNDIFRYLKEEEADEADEGETVEAVPVTKVDVHVDAPIESVEATKPKEKEVEKVEEKVEPTPEPEPVSAPSAPASKEVPVEAVAAAVPDKDIAPSEPAAVEEPAVPAPSAPAVEAPKPASPAPAKADIPNGSSAKPSAPAAAPAAPAAPAKPAAPRSWAAMAAGNAASKPAAAAAPAPTPAPAAAAPSTSAPAQKKEEAPAASSSGRNQAYDNANRVTTSHCFVKVRLTSLSSKPYSSANIQLPNWSLENQNSGEQVDEAAIKATAIRFGDVNKVEIVKQKACAFVEFSKVESARKAIIASLPTSQGGEGGVKIQGADGRLNFETRKEKDERKKGTGQSPTQSQGQGQSPTQQQGQGQQGGNRGGRTDRGGPGAGRGGRGGRGRGGAQQGGPAPQKA